jgi:signal transduction histidine kinase
VNFYKSIDTWGDILIGVKVGTAKQSCELMLEVCNTLVMMRSISSSVQTISALLDFSKLEAHAVKLSIAPLSLTDLLVDCQELLITLASEKQLDLTYNVDPDVPIVQGDGARMRQSE